MPRISGTWLNSSALQSPTLELRDKELARDNICREGGGESVFHIFGASGIYVCTQGGARWRRQRIVVCSHGEGQIIRRKDTSPSLPPPRSLPSLLPHSLLPSLPFSPFSPFAPFPSLSPDAPEARNHKNQTGGVSVARARSWRLDPKWSAAMAGKTVRAPACCLTAKKKHSTPVCKNVGGERVLPQTHVHLETIVGCTAPKCSLPFFKACLVPPRARIHRSSSRVLR